MLAIPLIIKQREDSISAFKEKIERGKMIEQRLQDCLNELKAIQIICESCENSSEIFSPHAEKAEIAAYYQKVIYQIHNKSIKVVKEDNKFLSNRKRLNHRD
ncbi:hypothetical protein [Okeania sp. SIO1I7]|uniref:hypothetical protein n=1 Tax=Okeania sp. SIO1I7 TaxID=2607772 RepID=UPI0025CE3927|nr:hypothetical protein [Okeania sp. SIO1I7]